MRLMFKALMSPSVAYNGVHDIRKTGGPSPVLFFRGNQPTNKLKLKTLNFHEYSLDFRKMRKKLSGSSGGGGVHCHVIGVRS